MKINKKKSRITNNTKLKNKKLKKKLKKYNFKKIQ